MMTATSLVGTTNLVVVGTPSIDGRRTVDVHSHRALR